MATATFFMKPASTVPPIGTSLRSGCGRSLSLTDRRESRRTHQIETSSNKAAPSSRNGCEDRLRKRGGHGRTDDCPDRRAGGDKSEQALALLRREDVNQHGPEDRNDNRLNTEIQMKKKRPIHTASSGVANWQGCAESQDGYSKEAIGQWNELSARQHLHQRRKRNIQHDHDDKRAGE